MVPGYSVVAINNMMTSNPNTAPMSASIRL
jgi:hypothetical protein